MSCEGDHEIQDARTGLHKVMVTEEAAVLLLLFVVTAAEQTLANISQGIFNQAKKRNSVF